MIDTPKTTIKNVQMSKFYAWQDTPQSIPSTTFTTVIFNKEIFDVKNEYNPANGIFTAKQAGFYGFAGNVVLSNVNTGTQFIVIIRHNGTARACGRFINGGLGHCGTGSTVILKLAANDTVDVQVYHNGTSYDTVAVEGYCQFSGHRIS